MMKRRLFALLLVVAMLSTMAIPAFAEGSTKSTVTLTSDDFLATGDYSLYNGESCTAKGVTLKCTIGLMYFSDLALQGMNGEESFEFSMADGSKIFKIEIVGGEGDIWNGTGVWEDANGAASVKFGAFWFGASSFVITYGPDTPNHVHNYAKAFSFDGENHWHECTAEGATEECRVPVPHTIKVRTNEEQTASTASCRECGAYLTLSATSGTTEHTVGDCVEIESNVPGAQALTPRIRNLDTKEIVKRNCKEEGNYQASLEVDGQYLIADFTLTNPKTTAATGDNRPIELLFAGFAALSVLAAAAFTMDRKRG